METASFQEMHESTVLFWNFLGTELAFYATVPLDLGGARGARGARDVAQQRWLVFPRRTFGGQFWFG